MSTACVVSARRANSRTDQVVGKSRQAGGVTAAVMQKAQSLWPNKTAAEVAVRAHVSSRSVERWSAGTRKISAEALAHLLRSDQGIQFLVVLMDQARPAWWSTLLRMGLLGGIQRRREADLRLLQQVADAERTTAAVFPAALMVQDPDYYGPLLEAVLATGGVPGRPVAQARPTNKRP